MGTISFQASNALVYVSYGAMLAFGLAVAYIYRHKKAFLASNGTQKGMSYFASLFICVTIAAH